MSQERQVSAPKSAKPLNRQRTRQRLSARFYRAVDYVSIYIFVLVVYGGAVVTDYLLFALLWLLLRDEVTKYPLVALGLDYARIGLALLFILSAVVHGTISAYSQIKLDIKLSRQGEGVK